jgi:hypothetical protein
MFFKKRKVTGAWSITQGNSQEVANYLSLASVLRGPAITNSQLSFPIRYQLQPFVNASQPGTLVVFVTTMVLVE